VKQNDFSGGLAWDRKGAWTVTFTHSRRSTFRRPASRVVSDKKTDDGNMCTTTAEPCRSNSASRV